MRRICLILAVCATVLFTVTSCVTAQAFDTTYHPQDIDDNLAVVDNVCYVYYSNPTTLFLNSLKVIDGTYYYWYMGKCLPVVFPNWEIWSPHRYFYYDRNRWLWRDRLHYDHNAYRKNHHWKDYRRPNRRTVTPPKHRPNIDRIPPRPSGGYNYRTRPNRGSSTRVTVHNRDNRSFGHAVPNNSTFSRGGTTRTEPNQRGGHFGGRR